MPMYDDGFLGVEGRVGLNPQMPVCTDVAKTDRNANRKRTETGLADKF